MPITAPLAVAPNEIIESAWGNSVRSAIIEIDNEMVEKAGDTMTGTLTADVNGALGLNVLPASASPSERAGIRLGSWEIGQDVSSNGTRNFYIFDLERGLAFDLGPAAAPSAQVNSKLTSVHSATDGNWNNANFVANNQGSLGARIALYDRGFTAQWRTLQSTAIEARNGQDSAYAEVRASAFTVNSARDTKTGIRDSEPVHGKVAALGKTKRFKRAQRPVYPRPTDDDPDAIVEHGDQCSPDTCGSTPDAPCADFRNEIAADKYGLVAEDVAAAIPEIAIYDGDGKPIGWDVPQMVAVLLGTIEELTARITALEGAQP